MVYVLNVDGTPLMPTTRYGKVRRMLNRNQAKVVKRNPFTIQLLYKTTYNTQPITVGVDAGNKKIGISAKTVYGKEVYVSEIELRKDVSLLVEQRKRLRNVRRRRNKRRKSNPTLKKNYVKKLLPYQVFEGIDPRKQPAKYRQKVAYVQKVQSHVSAINRLNKILPIKTIIVETGQFNRRVLNKLGDNDKLTSEYITNQREYVFSRDDHTCLWCKGKTGDKILRTFPIITQSMNRDPFWKAGVTSHNTATLCNTCYNKFEKETLDYNKKIEENHKVGKRAPYKHKIKEMRSALYHIVDRIHDHSKNGTMRVNVYKELSKKYDDVRFTLGYKVKNKRIQLGVENTPINNARIIIGYPNKTLDKYYYMKLRRNHNRQLHKATPQKGTGIRSPKSPYFTKGFASYDLVEYNGKEYYITKKRKTGYFGLGDASGKTLINSVKWDKIRLLQRNKSYSIETRYC